MITTMFIFGLLIATSMIITFIKLPRQIKQWAVEHDLITDAVAGFFITTLAFMISKTLIAFGAAVIAEIFLALFIKVYKYV